MHKILLAVAVVVATIIAAMAAGPATAQGSGADQYCSFGTAQADQYRGCDEEEVIILPLPEPINEVPNQTILPVDVPGQGVVNVQVSGIVSIVDGGGSIVVQPEAVDLVSGAATFEEGADEAVAGEEAAVEENVVEEAAVEENVVEENVVEEVAAPESSVAADAAGPVEAETAVPQEASVKPLPSTGGPDVWLAALVVSGVLAVLFGVLLFRRGSFGP